MQNNAVDAAAKSKATVIIADGNSGTVGVGVSVVFGEELAVGAEVGEGVEVEVDVEDGEDDGVGVEVRVGLAVGDGE